MWTLPALGVATCALTWAGRGSVGLYVAAGVAWAIAVVLLPRLPARREQLALIALVAIAMRAPGWLSEPRYSDDVWRYLWDGRVQRAGFGAYQFAPDAPELAPLRDDNWQRINHKELPTLYPPAAQLLFRVTPSLPVWKALVAIADLALLALLMMRLPDRRLALAWGWSPLAAIELAQEAHLDAFAVALLTAALLSTRKWIAGALLGLSSAVKLLAVAILPSLRSLRAIAAFVIVLALCAAPFARQPIAGSLGEFSRRWQGNDGAFALLQAGAEQVVAHTRFAKRYIPESPELARFITGRQYRSVYPDEAANFLARLAVLALLAAVLAWTFRRRLPPDAAAEAILGAFLLLTPILHPWYVVWMVPIVALRPRPAWLALAALVPLGYAGDDFRPLVHAPVWLLLLLNAWTARKRAVHSSSS
jgi:hypothetical protein